MHAKMIIGFFVALVLGTGMLWAQDGFVVSGHVSATDSEVDEGYFGIGQETAIVARPGTAAHAWLKAHAGQRIRLTLEGEGESH